MPRPSSLRNPVVPRSVIPPLGCHGLPLHAVPSSFRSHRRPDRGRPLETLPYLCKPRAMNRRRMDMRWWRLTLFVASTLALCESMSGPRVAMTPEELSCVLKPFVTSRSWHLYDESARVSETKLHEGNALTHVALLTALQEHSPGLVITWSVVSAALKQMVVQFGMSQDSSKDWVETMTSRLQNLCRTVSQSLRKNPRSEFCRDIPDNDRHRWNLVTRGVRSRTPFGLASFAGRDRTSRDVEPALFCPRERNQPTHR